VSARTDQVRRVVRAILADKEAPTFDQLKAAVSQAAAVAYADRNVSGEVDEPSVVREFEAIYSVHFPAQSQVLEDKTGHVPWLPDLRGTIQWNFWGRYEYFLREVQRLPPQVVVRLGTATDDVLAQLENPLRDGSWDRRGLAVGNVQSGKTSNYSGLICKALDAGYKLVVVLAGIHNSLRSQTQMRIDQGIIGFDTSQNPAFSDDNQWIGVGVLPTWPRLRVNALTNSRNGGDFSRGTASRITTSLGGDPYVLVIKKNKSILANLIKWALHVNGVPGPAGRKVIRNVPLLVIDDEADNASINTARVPPGEDPKDYDPTAINAKIRELLGAFDKKAYIGYTATPFANIFVPADASHEDLEDDVFPRSFIYSLTEPSNYVGAARVFGLAGDPDAGIEPQEGLPIVCILKDYLPFFPETYGKDHDPGGLPPSLRKAIRVFVLSSAARRVRGSVSVHNSMLIHVARFVDVQKRLYDLVQEDVVQLVRRLRYGEKGDDPIWSELQELWKDDFEPVWRVDAFRELGYQPVTWGALRKEIREAAERIRVKLINGQASDILDYHEHPNGINVIAIGGDKLSRGLTLEGLTVSYYLRASRMYDTLMQMGRWFGYRDGYLDLCRLYTTEDLRDWYRHIASVDIELRREFQTMVDCRMTPTEYGLRVRTHPGGLLITALNKSRYTTPLSVSFSGRLVQTKYLYSDEKMRKQNVTAAVKLLRDLGSGTQDEHRDQVLWRAVPHTWVCTFLREVSVPVKDVDANGGRLAEFIEKQIPSDALVKWSVLLAGGAAKGAEPFPIGRNIVPVVRSPATPPGDGPLPPVVALRKANILNPPDQYADFRGVPLTEDHFEELAQRQVFSLGGGGADLVILRKGVGHDLAEVALDVTLSRHSRGEIKSGSGGPPKAPNGRVVRDMRARGEGLLVIYPTMAEVKSEPKISMIGFAVSFPRDDNSVPVEYLVNQVYEQLHLFDDAADVDV